MQASHQTRYEEEKKGEQSSEEDDLAGLIENLNLTAFSEEPSRGLDRT